MKTILMLVCLSIMFIFYGCQSSIMSTNDIFNSTMKSILEVKAHTDQVGTSFGTAVILKEDGVLVTNYHVVSYTMVSQHHLHDNIYVRLATEETYLAVTIISYDENNDLAFMKLNTLTNLVSITIGNSTQLKFGDSIFAVGNSNNHGIGITSGIVSVPLVNVLHNGVVRSVIQCDITITSGNSGGALLDEIGHIVGITTFRIRDGGGDVIYGLGYAIPINHVIYTYEQIGII